MARAAAERNTWTIALLEIKSGDRILDVGCGPDALIHAIAEQTTESVVAGVDTSPVMLKQATGRNAGFIQQRRVQLHQGSALALPFSAAAFNMVLFANSVQLWSDQLAGVTEMRRVLKPDGRIALILHPVWVKTNDQVKEIGNELLELLSERFSVEESCVSGNEADRERGRARHAAELAVNICLFGFGSPSSDKHVRFRTWRQVTTPRPPIAN